MIGETLSHYRILEKIGEGGMGEVYLAEDARLLRKVALKLLPEALTRDPERNQRFVQEARAAAAVEHPSIAAIYDVDEVRGRSFIAMEYVRGESLRQAIANKKLGLGRALSLAIQVAEGMAKAHERGVVHRDLKPANILISEDGYAKVIDFGVAKLLAPLAQDTEGETLLKTSEGQVAGTVSYMSPEQARGETLDARSDIFSLGVVLYQMLSGTAPFLRPSAAETLSAILKEAAPPLALEGAETPPELQRILKKVLAKDPADRDGSMKDLALDLRLLKEDVASTGATRARVAPPGRSPLAWLAGGLATAVAVVIAVYLLHGGLGKRPPPGIGPSGRPAIAVMYFEDHTGSEEIRWLSRGLPNMLTTGLAQTPGLDVVSSQRIQEILRQVGAEDLDVIDKAVVSEVARRAGAGAVVAGSIFKSGAEVRIDVQVEDVGSGRVLAAQSVRGSDIFGLVDELAGRIRGGLELTEAPSARSITEITTPSLEAYRLFSEAMEAFRNVRYPDARRRMQRAVEIDPAFAIAYFYLSVMAERVGEPAASAEYMRKALNPRRAAPAASKAPGASGPGGAGRPTATGGGAPGKAPRQLSRRGDRLPRAGDRLRGPPERCREISQHH
jgi:TolB-like protein/predicted Ser/Thr protein kinase